MIIAHIAGMPLEETLGFGLPPLVLVATLVAARLKALHDDLRSQFRRRG